MPNNLSSLENNYCSDIINLDHNAKNIGIEEGEQSNDGSIVHLPGESQKILQIRMSSRLNTAEKEIEEKKQIKLNISSLNPP